ncbi:MAG: hypothetical protein SVG88_04040 [Halobacteriales archaeon]|nr:hypothetical protein [Halobacteriales archaeon]
MSITDRTNDRNASQENVVDTPPEFELEYLYDDPDDPAEVTIFLDADEADLSTHWITIDRSSAVPIEDTR